MKSKIIQKTLVVSITLILITLIFAPTIYGRSISQSTINIQPQQNTSVEKLPITVIPQTKTESKGNTGRNNSIYLNLPTSTVTYKVQHTGPTSYFASTLLNIPPGYDVANGTYVGWCTDLDHTIQSNHLYTVTLYNSYNTSVPTHIYHQNWSKVNYILNHKQGTDWWQVQYAIYYILDFGNQGLNTNGWAMVNNATLYGSNYTPGIGDIIAVIVDAGTSVQRTIIEVNMPVFTLTLNIVGNGNVSKSPDQTSYLYGTIVTLTANSDIGWSFDNWSGDLSGTTNPIQLNIDGDKSIIATFTENQYLLTITINGNGSVTKMPDQVTYTYGTVVSLTAVADPGWSFSAWSGDLTGSSNPDSIVMTGDKSVTATFTQDQYTLTVMVVGNGSVTKMPDQVTYTYGTVVSLTAVADPGWSFSAWSGDLTGSSNPDSIVMTGDKSVTATFTQDQYILNVTIIGTGNVIIDPSQSTYTYGTIVTLTATACPWWHFSHWSGDLSGTTNPSNITMTGNKYVTAHFEIDEYSLEIIIQGNGTVIKDPDQIIYTAGTLINLTAIPDAGWKFLEWTGDLTGTTNPTYVVMDHNKTITAHFTNEYLIEITIEGQGSVLKDPDLQTYAYGTMVELTAVPAEGWEFSHWSGDITGTDNPAYLLIDGDKQVTAVFTGSPDTTAPTVDITKPENAMYILDNKILPFPLPVFFQGITIEVDAQDNESGVAYVEFYIDDELIDTDVEAPYSYTWRESGASKMRHNIKVIAYDNADNSAFDEITVLKWRFHPALIALFLLIGFILYRGGT